MNEWSRRRKRIILSIILGILIVLIGAPLFFFFYKPASCNDGKQNGDETGVDCGGGCKLICQADYLPIIQKGDPQVIRVSTTTYALVIHAENPNVNGQVLRAGYTMKVYEASSTIPIKIIDGATFVPKASIFAVFAGPLSFGESIPYRATFEWKKDTLVWVKNDLPIPDLNIQNKVLSTENNQPRLTAEVKNESLDPVKNIELTALIFDNTGNIVGVSKTLVDEVDKGGTESVIFTWPTNFEKEPASEEILLKVLPDKSYI
jgi:hypothetical protein